MIIIPNTKFSEMKGMDEDHCFLGWTSKIPQGFSCGLAITYSNLNEFVPVDCSEVVIKVATPRDCSDGDFGDDCFDYPNWVI